MIMCFTVLMRESLRFLLFEWLSSFSFLVFAIYGNICFCLNTLVVLSEPHILLDIGNLCHSDVWCRLCCLLRIYMSTVILNFCTALLAPCASKLVYHFYSHFCLVLAFVHCAFLQLLHLASGLWFSVFSLFSFSLACMCFLPLKLFFYISVKLI